jgi:NADH-quinone oxidoreductase subunit G
MIMSEEKKIDLVTINVDGKHVDVPAGMNLIDAVKRYAGVEIPHYCYHSKLSVAGNCRMCLVEMGTPMMDRATGQPVLDEQGAVKIGWMPKPGIACSTKVSAGLHVKTDSPVVKECRNGVMEFLLVNHPLDCPICDQAGECRLQQFATDYGRGYSRFIEAKNVKPKRSRIGPRVTLDDERCILCSRCVRFSEEITKDNALGFVDRGSYSTLTCYPGREFDNNYSLNVVDLCPVGALTDTDFRFKMRVWFLKPTPSICTESSVGVNTQVWSREGKIYRITPRQNDEVNDTWMSDSGRRLYKLTESDNRIKEHLISGVVAERAAAIAAAVELLKAGSVGVIGSGNSSVEEQYALSAISKVTESPTWVIPHIGEGDGFLISADRTPNTRGALMTALIDAVPYKSVDSLKKQLGSGKLKTLLVVGEDIVTAGIEESTLAGISVIYIGTESNATSRLARVVIPSLTVFEKSGSFINQTFRLQRFAQAIPGPKGVADDLKTLAALLTGLGAASAPDTVQGIWDVISTEIPAFSGISFARIPAEGIALQAGKVANLPFVEGATLHFDGSSQNVNLSTSHL